MLLTIIAAAGLATSSPSPREQVAQLGAAQAAWRGCLTEETVRLGSGNQESAETVLHAAADACRPQEAAVRELLGAMPLPTGHAETLMRRDRKLGEDAGVAALLAARAR